MTTAQEIKEFLNKDNDVWYGAVLENIIDTYHEDISLEEIEYILEEEVEEFKQGYEDWKGYINV
jgi:hypothetical protein|tara:strand:- start:307 stop:498 length:192 start_codon:yes stop_codon:yes gene_type:complete